MKKTTEEIDTFRGADVGKKSQADSPLGVSYIVKGSYLDSNDCMKTYGIDSNGKDAESFIDDTRYSE